MKKISLLFAAILLVSATALAVSPRALDDIKYFQGTGQIISIDADKFGAIIKHGRIEGFMGAMTMRYEAENAAVFNAVKPGDFVRFTIKDTDEGTQIIKVERTRPPTKNKVKE